MQVFWIQCKIERGGFSSERTFEIETPQGKVVGTAFVAHLSDENRKPLGPDIPPVGEQIKGFVKCRIIRRKDDQALVEFPSTDVMYVPSDELVPA